MDLALDQPFENPEQVVRRDAEHRRAQAAERIERDDRSCPARLRAVSRLTRWTSVATAQTLPGGLSLTVLMMYSVEPLSSAAWTTSNVHSGCATTLPPGYFLRNASICGTVKRVCTEQWPFHRISFARLDLLRLEAAPHLVRIPHDHLVERHAHLEGGVAAEMLIGQHQQLLAALPRPLHDRRGVGRRADDAAVVADERFDRRRRVDVGDRDHARRVPFSTASVRTPICSSSRQHISS